MNNDILVVSVLFLIRRLSLNILLFVLHHYYEGTRNGGISANRYGYFYNLKMWVDPKYY